MPAGPQSPASAKVLYISYDGLTDPLGRSQVLPYLVGCARRGHRIAILSCEKAAAFAKSGAAVRALCEASGIDWHPQRYHRRPPVLSTVYDIGQLGRHAFALHRERRFDLVHCRSYIPAIVGLKLKEGRGVPLLFDMRGFWPDERLESGSWNLRNPLYRAVYTYFKRLESRLLRASDHIVSLTEAARARLIARPELSGREDIVTVIPTCVDFDHFGLAAPAREATRESLGVDRDEHVLGYVGSLGGNYRLGEMLDFFRLYEQRHPGAVFLFVTMEDPSEIIAAARLRDLDSGHIIVRAASRDEVPQLIAGADLGIAFKQPSFSAEACAPTKLGEMLAMGIPMVANAGVGDVEPVLAGTGGGAIIRGFDAASYVAAIERVESIAVPGEELRARARELFDLEAAVERYSEIYQKLAITSRARSPA